MLQKSLSALICLLIHFGANAQAKNETFTGGYSHSLVVCRNGNISSFGDNTLQQLGRDEMLVYDEAPGSIDYSDLPPIQSVHSSLSHSLALACDGTVWAWGDGTFGQLGNNSLTGKDNLPCHVSGPTPPNCLITKPIQVVGGETGTPYLENIVKVVAGYQNSYAITEDGKLLAWGANDKGLLGNGTTGNPSASPAFVLDSLNNPLTDVLDVCATMYCTYIILDPDGDYAGNVYVFGDHTESNSFSMIGPNKTASYYPTPIRTQDGEIIRGITNLAGGDTHALFLDWHNQLWAIGGDWGPGQLGISEQPFVGYEKGYPYRVLAGEQKNMKGYENETYLSDVKDISAGYAHSLAIVECNGVRYMMAWGNNEFGQLGTGDKMGGILPHFVMQNTTSKLLNVQSISSGRNNSMAKTVDFDTFEESLYIWGDSEYGQVGNTLSKAVTFPLEFQEIECSTANLCPIADFGSDTLCVCPSEMDTSLNQSILLDAGGSESIHFEYRWEAILNDGRVLNNEFLKSFWIPNSNGKTIRCFFEGKYKVSVEEITNQRACNNCPIATDSIIIKHKLASFTQTATSFTGKTMPVKLTVTKGVDYAFYAQETDQSPLATATNNNGAVQAELNTNDLERVNSVNGASLPEDSVYYQVWVESDAESCSRLPIFMKQLYEDSTAITYNTCGPHDFNGTVLTKSGTYRKIINNTPGNNSLVILNLTIDTLFSEMTSVAIADGDSYSWRGKELTESGIYNDTITNEDGCACVYTLRLTTGKEEIKNELTETACGSYEFAGKTLTQSGTYYDTLALNNLKDSITVLNLTVLNSKQTELKAEITKGSAYPFNNNRLTVSGVYIDSLTSANGCDSIVRLTLNTRTDQNQSNNFQNSTMISGGQAHSIALCSNGAIYVWGDNKHYQLGQEIHAYDNIPTYFSMDSPPIKAVDAGSGNFNIALACDGTVWAWGEGAYGQLGDGNDHGLDGEACMSSDGGDGNCDQSKAVQVIAGESSSKKEFLNNATHIAAGADASYAITEDGKVYGWGNNDKAQLGQGEVSAPVFSPVLINLPGKAIAIDATDYGCYALIANNDGETGTVYAWGSCDYHSLGTDITIKTPKPVLKDDKVSILDNIVMIAAGGTQGLFLDNEGYLWDMGYKWIPYPENKVKGYASKVCAGEQHIINGYEHQAYLTNVKDIATGEDHFLAVTEYGGIKYLMAWGAGKHGQLGQGSIYDKYLPHFVKLTANEKLINVQSVSAGDFTSYAVTYNPSTQVTKTYAWGKNDYGQTSASRLSVTNYPFEIDFDDGSIANPCPKINFGADTLWVCPDDFDPENGKHILLTSGYTAKPFAYEWKMQDDYNTTIEGEQIKNMWADAQGTSLKAFTTGTYTLTIKDFSTPWQTLCEKCPDATDSIVIQYNSPSFTLKDNTFYGDTITLRLNAANGNKYAFYAQETDTDFLSSTTINEDTASLMLNISKLKTVATNSNGQAYPENSTYYQLWVEDQSENLNSKFSCGRTSIHLKQLKKPVFTNIEESICGKYQFGDLELNQTGIYKDTLAAASGADSIVTLKLIIDTVIAEAEIAEITFGDSYNWMGKEINQSGFYRDTTADENGCATIYRLQLNIIKKEVIVELTETACGSFEFAGKTLTQSDTYYDTVALNDLKDSITLLILTVNPTYEILLSEEIEEGQTFTFNGQELSDAGEYTAELKTVNGCDSIVKLELTVIPAGTVFTSIEESVCGKYQFGDLELYQTGIYKDTLTAESGADSIVTLKLTIDTVIAEVEIAEITYGESYSWMGKEINQSGFYRDTTADENGCATIYSLQLNVLKNEIVVEISETACGSYEFAGRTLTQNGTYYDTLALNDLKDSITVLALTINPAYDILINEEIEEGQTYAFNGQELSDAGEYTAELKTVYGCDSIVKLELTIIPYGTVFTNLEESVCGKYQFGDLELKQTGIYKDTLAAASGADSIVTLKLTIDTVIAEVEIAEITFGDSYNWMGKEINQSGFYRDTTADENGCATIYSLQLNTLKKEVIVELTKTACGSYEFAGRTLTQNGTYYDTLALNDLKDSITVLALTINPAYDILISEEIEEGQTYAFNGQELSDAGEYTAELKTVNGCDSIVKLELKVIPDGTVFTSIEESICGKYQFGNLELNQTGIYKDTLTAESGADSIVTLKLTIDTVIAEVEIAEITYGESYSWMGKEINQSGLYRDTTADENGCATIHALEISTSGTTKIRKQQKYKVEIYPTAVSDKLIVLAPASSEITLVSALGETILKANCNGKQALNLSTFANGPYFVKVKLANGECIEKMIIKK